MNDNDKNQGDGLNGGAGASSGRTPDKYGDVVQSILGDLSPDAVNLRATIAQRAPYASPQQVEQIANAVQSRLGSAALTPEADAVINDVLAALGASGAFNQPAPTNQPPGYAPYSPYPQYPGAQQYPYPQSQYPGAQSPYPYQPTQPQYPYRNAQSPPQQGYPLPNAFNYIPQQPTQGWGAPGQGTPPAFPYAQPPQAPPYYSQQGYAQPSQQNYQQPQAQQPNAPFSYGAAYNAPQPTSDWSALAQTSPAQTTPTVPTTPTSPPTPTSPTATTTATPTPVEPSASQAQPLTVATGVEPKSEPKPGAKPVKPVESTPAPAAASGASSHAAAKKPSRSHKKPSEPTRQASQTPQTTKPTASRGTTNATEKPAAPQSSTHSEPRADRAHAPKSRREQTQQAPPIPAPPPIRAPRAERPAPGPRTESLSDDLASLAAAASVARKPATSDLSALSASAGVAAINLNALRSTSAGAVSTDAFLQLLGRRAPKQNVSASTLGLLNDQSTLEKAKEDAPMWLMSIALHIAIALLLALLVWKTPIKNAFEVVSEPGFRDEVVLDEVFDPNAGFEMNEEVEIEMKSAPEVDADIKADVADISAFDDVTAVPLSVTETEIGLEAPLEEVDNLLGSLIEDDLSGRGDNKAAALATGGGSEGSEKSVALALAWLAEHQLPNGSWCFDLRYCPTCGGACGNSGSYNSNVAATAMGLLPFLAAGHTPTQGKYKRVVADGLNYLLDQGKEEENGLSFWDGVGRMYTQALVAITLCETYAMLSEKEKIRYRRLGYMAQSAVNYIEAAQTADGGWRYYFQGLQDNPRGEGDTSVFGWQMMALKSASLGGLEVDDNVVRGARNFLRDVVSYNDETAYRYSRTNPSDNATSAIGLLCRLYLDWRPDNPKLLRGAARLSGVGPKFDNPYYNYYTAQLMHNVGGAMWNKWNQETRDKLCAQQVMEGHERGSWFPTKADNHCQMGGRLYATSLNCMVLEVYYRHMPLYQRMEAGSQFPTEVLDGETVYEGLPDDLGDLDDRPKESKEPEKKEEESSPKEGDQPDAPKPEAEAPKEGESAEAKDE